MLKHTRTQKLRRIACTLCMILSILHQMHKARSARLRGVMILVQQYVEDLVRREWKGRFVGLEDRSRVRHPAHEACRPHLTAEETRSMQSATESEAVDNRLRRSAGGVRAVSEVEKTSPAPSGRPRSTLVLSDSRAHHARGTVAESITRGPAAELARAN